MEHSGNRETCATYSSSVECSGSNLEQCDVRDFDTGSDTVAESLSIEDDDDLPIVNLGNHRNTETLEDWRRIRDEQDKAYEESLVMDQKKEMLAKESKRQIENREALKDLLRSFLSKRTRTSNNFNIELCFKLVDGITVQASFQSEDTGQILYQYVFSNTKTEGNFKLFTGDIPRQEILPDTRSLSEYALGSRCVIIVELTSESVFNEEKWAADMESVLTIHSEENSLDILKSEEKSRSDFMKGLSCTTSLVPYRVRRSFLFDDLLALYNIHDNLPQVYPLELEFVGEQAIDLGGVSRDVFTAFWLIACEKLFDGNKLLIPVVSPHVDMSVLPALGKILSHGYFCTGYLPTQIAFPSLVAIIHGPMVILANTTLIESFLDFVCDIDRDILSKAITQKDFNPEMKEQLLTVLSTYGCRQIPSPENLSKVIAEIAKFTFLTNPMSALSMINSGIPSQHQLFWSKKSCSDLYQLYRSLTATPSLVLSLLGEPYCANLAQKATFGYLRQYIGSMTLDQVRLFLRFVTGSSVCTGAKLDLQFNVLSGLARRPISHTCSNTLELSTTYNSYPEFVKEFEYVLRDNLWTWIMDAL